VKLNPAYLGLAAFALTTFILSLANIGYIDGGIAISLAFFYGGMTQFASGMLSFKADDNFGGTAFSSYGAFWLSFGMMEILSKLGIYTPGNAEKGAMMIAWGIFTFYMWIPSLKVGKILSLVFLTLWLTFFILGISFIFNYTTQAGGFMGLVCAFLAWYVSFAGITGEIYQKKLLI